MNMTNFPLKSLTLALLLTGASACGGPAEVNEQEAANLAAELEAGANNATDETEAEVLREQANSLREASEGNEAADEGQVVTGE
jgi:hypothetical protein